eukprot:scaffold1112_cov92-Amphora_coffeaeformis.AAC.35
MKIVEEWQRRQKEEKDKDRRQKQATAELLSGYRGQGLSEEEIKLKLLREEERQKKLEAEQRLREFKKLEEPMARHKNANNHNNSQQQQGAIPLPVNARGSEHTDDPITFGSVSAIKANFNGNASFSQPSNRSQSTDDPTRISEVPPSASVAVTEPVAGDVNAYQEVSSLAPNDGATTTTTTTLAPPISSTEEDNNNNNDGITMEQQPRGGGFDFMAKADTATKNEGGTDAAAHSTPPVAFQETPPLTATSTTVYFKFGVISTQIDNNPQLLPPYRQAIEFILAESSNMMNADVTAVRIHTAQPDADFTAQQSPSRSDRPSVKRVLVTIGVDLQVIGNNTATADNVETVKQHVYQTVGQAIQTGQLLELSRQYTQT